MALTKIKEIVCLLDLDWTGRKKLDGGLVRIGSVDGRDDLTGRVTDELHRPSCVRRSMESVFQCNSVP